MSPIVVKKSWREINKERKTIKKQRREKKLLKQLGLEHNNDSDISKIVTDEPERDDVEIQECVDESIPKHTQNNLRTISIAVPGSILDNAQSPELRTYLAGQIARAACIFNVDEIIVFNDATIKYNKPTVPINNGTSQACLQLARILQYLECPQYLRKFIFPIHKDLQYAGLLNPLDAPHHLRQTDEFPFREGIVSDVPVKKGQGSFVNIGLFKDVKVDKQLTPKLRVTVKLDSPKENSKKQYGVIVPPSQPKQELGVYWGYTVRLADSLSDIFINSPHKDGYDLSIGTSDKGKSIDDILKCDDNNAVPNNYKHCLIVFGGLDGLETALECDEKLTCTEISLLFDLYINTCPRQGSKTIRTEEAILISLAELRRLLRF